MKTVIFLCVIACVLGCLVALPTISIDVDAAVESDAFAYVRAALYFFPVDTVWGIISLTLTLWVFRIIIAFIKTIWDLLPVA